jgi:hypothetical protein
VSALAVFAAVAAGSTTATAAETAHRSAGPRVAKDFPRVAKGSASPQVASGAAPATVAPAGTPVPLPDLGLAQRRSDGGLNLARIPLSDLEDGFGTPFSVVQLPATTHFSYDRSHVVAGDFANFTADDDGTADHVIWHLAADGGVLVYIVAGGSTAQPQLLRTLPKSAGWSWADSRPIAGDVNGDGWDDLVIVHRGSPGTVVVWAMLSDGTTLGAPVRWGTAAYDFSNTRNYVADADGDGYEDLITTARGTTTSTAFTTSVLLTNPGGTAAVRSPIVAGSYPTSRGWSWTYSRQLAGDVDGDGYADLVTVHRSGTGGVIVWVQANCSSAPGNVCWTTPVRWQTLSGGWSFLGSRQYLADTNGDYVDDLVSVHSTPSGEIIWRHVSTGGGFAAPLRVSTLAASAGWNWSTTRESVADTWGTIGP